MGYLLTYLSWPPFIVWVGFAIAALFIRRTGACLFVTVVSLLLAMILMFMWMFQDCFPSATVTCPTDIERNIMFYATGLGTLAFNALMWVRISRRPSKAR